jgi:hypothetical protein
MESIIYEPERDYYRQLDVAPSATPDEIQRVYRERAKQVHPDRNPERQAWAHTQIQQLNTIKDVLLDPELRAEYDRQRSAYLFSLFGEPQAKPRWQPASRRVAYVENVRRLRRVGTILTTLGITLLIASLALGVSMSNDVQQTPSLYTPVTLKQLVQTKPLPLAATLKLDGLDCKALAQNTISSNGYLISADKQTLAMISFYGTKPCSAHSETTITGSVSFMSGGMRDQLISEGVLTRYPQVSTFIYVCQDCGSSDPKGGVEMMAFLVLMSLFAVFLGGRMLMQARGKAQRG